MKKYKEGILGGLIGGIIAFLLVIVIFLIPHILYLNGGLLFLSIVYFYGWILLAPLGLITAIGVNKGYKVKGIIDQKYPIIVLVMTFMIITIGLLILLLSNASALEYLYGACSESNERIAYGDILFTYFPSILFIILGAFIVFKKAYKNVEEDSNIAKTIVKKKQNKSIWIAILIGVGGGISSAVLSYHLWLAPLFELDLGDPINIVEKDSIIYIDDGAFTIDKATLIGIYDEDTETYVITGTITNESSRTPDGISINFVLLDEDGHIIAEVFAETGRLNPGESWSFRTEAFEEFDARNVKRFKLRYVSPFGIDYFEG